jgi:hypothetical protein
LTGAPKAKFNVIESNGCEQCLNWVCLCCHPESDNGRKIRINQDSDTKFKSYDSSFELDMHYATRNLAFGVCAELELEIETCRKLPDVLYGRVARTPAWAPNPGVQTLESKLHGAPSKPFYAKPNRDIPNLVAFPSLYRTNMNLGNQIALK